MTLLTEDKIQELKSLYKDIPLYKIKRKDQEYLLRNPTRKEWITSVAKSFGPDSFICLFDECVIFPETKEELIALKKQDENIPLAVGKKLAALLAEDEINDSDDGKVYYLSLIHIYWR